MHCFGPCRECKKIFQCDVSPSQSMPAVPTCCCPIDQCPQLVPVRNDGPKWMLTFSSRHSSWHVAAVGVVRLVFRGSPGLEAFQNPSMWRQGCQLHLSAESAMCHWSLIATLAKSEWLAIGKQKSCYSLVIWQGPTANLCGGSIVDFGEKTRERNQGLSRITKVAFADVLVAIDSQ